MPKEREIMETSDDELKKKLDKIRKKLLESQKLDAETSRRYSVANEKMAGYLIELIESQRDKLKDKKRVGKLLGILLRINDLRVQVMTEYLSFRVEPLRKIRPLKALPVLQATSKMVEVYNQIRTDLASFFYNEDSKTINLPFVPSTKPIGPESKLMQLNVCLGQLQGLVLGRLYESL
ncbi:hypothetical protein E3J74_01320 [Candidatus Bathyarchaeota archaeon]|nr:MAG: hypothetical protein E3J74_01320 [Candidatus Bathyarchaeota archaeon]